MTTTHSEIRRIPLDALVLSETPAQQERRKHFNQKKLEDLATSIKAVDVLEPILVRPNPQHGNGPGAAEYEVVFGECRVIGAEAAGLEDIPATIRELSDEQVFELQLIENLQRQELSPIAEAEAYNSLHKLGRSTEELAAKVGVSKGTIYARMKLLDCGPAARQALYDGKLSASVALLLARIPNAGIQRKACGELVEGYNGTPLNYRQASEHIQRHYMLRLAEAPFDVKDERLVHGAVACGRCPKRTGNQPELFEDIKSGDTCTDPPCFNAKREATTARAIAAARDAGHKVIDGKKAKEVKPYEHSNELRGGYVSLDARCYDDRQQRTYRQIVGKSEGVALLKAPKTGELIEVIHEKDLKPILKEKGVAKPQSTRSSSVRRRSTASSPDRVEAKRAAEFAFRVKLWHAVRTKVQGRLGRGELIAIASYLYDGVAGIDDEIHRIWKLSPTVKVLYGDKLREAIGKISDRDLPRFIFDCLVGEDMDGYGKAVQLYAAAKRYKVDAAKLRREFDAEQKAKAAAAKKAVPAKSTQGKPNAKKARKAA